MTNTFNRFQTLLGKESTDVVEITALNANGTSQALTLSGSAITIKGESVAVGQKAFVRGGEIIRQAPNLTPVQVSI
jgi:hypothetical protein